MFKSRFPLHTLLALSIRLRRTEAAGYARIGFFVSPGTVPEATCQAHPRALDLGACSLRSQCPQTPRSRRQSLTLARGSPRVHPACAYGPIASDVSIHKKPFRFRYFCSTTFDFDSISESIPKTSNWYCLTMSDEH